MHCILGAGCEEVDDAKCTVLRDLPKHHPEAVLGGTEGVTNLVFLSTPKINDCLGYFQCLCTEKCTNWNWGFKIVLLQL